MHPKSPTVGVDAIITTDIGLAENYNRRYFAIEGRFRDMVLNLSEFYGALTPTSGCNDSCGPQHDLTPTPRLD